MSFIKKTGGVSLGSFFSYFFIAVLITPLIFIFSKVFSSNTPTAANILSLFLGTYIKNTAIILLFTLPICLTIGFISAYLFTFYDFAGKKLCEFLIILPFAIPSYILAYIYTDFFSYGGVLYHLFKGLFGIPFHKDIMTIGGTIFILSYAFYPYAYLILRGYMKRLDKNLLDTAASLGASPLGILFRIIIPVSYPALLSAGLLITMECLNAFGVPSYFGVQVFSTGIYQAWISYRDMAAAIQLSFIVLLGIALLAGITYVVKNTKKYQYASGKIAFVRPKRITGKQQALVLTAVIVLVSISFIIPCAHLFMWLYHGYANTDIPARSLYATIIIGLVSASAIVIISIILANRTRYTMSRFSTLLFRLATIGYGIPGIIVGIATLSVFITFDRSITGGLFFTLTVLPLLIAYIIRFIMLAYNSIDAGFNKLGVTFSKAARTLGAGDVKTLLLIDIPLIKTNIIAGFLLSFIEIIKDLPITALLIPFQYQTLAIEINNYAGQEELMHTALPSLFIIGISTVLLYAFMRNKEK